MYLPTGSCIASLVEAHTCIYTRTHAHKRRPKHIYTHTHTHTHTCTHLRKHAHTCTHTNTRVHTHTQTHTHTHTHTHIHGHTHKQTHTHTYTLYLHRFELSRPCQAQKDSGVTGNVFASVCVCVCVRVCLCKFMYVCLRRTKQHHTFTIGAQNQIYANTTTSPTPGPSLGGEYCDSTCCSKHHDRYSLTPQPLLSCTTIVTP
jgi:hypothetical protein